MPSMLEKLYYGELMPDCRSMEKASKYRREAGALAAAEKVLRETLSSEQITAFERYEDAAFHCSTIDTMERFLYGFRVGLLMGLEISEIDDKYIMDVTG